MCLASFMWTSSCGPTNSQSPPTVSEGSSFRSSVRRQLYGEHHPPRISLPTYPFARERYWLAEKTVPHQPSTMNHPQLQTLSENTSITYIPRWEELSGSTPRTLNRPHQVILMVYAASSLQFAVTIRDHYSQEQATDKIIENAKSA